MILHAIQFGEGPPVVLLHGLFGAARNFGTIQRALTANFKVVALDMRNHGDSAHGDDMRYVTLAADVQETLESLGIGQAAIIGHSMGGKAAMALALTFPPSVGRLLVADIAPVAYEHGNRAIADAMRAIPLAASLTRQQADGALTEAVPRPDIRAFLLQNLRLGTDPHWRIGLSEIAAAIPDLEGWDDYLAANTVPGAATSPMTYPGPTLFVTGANSEYVLPEHRPIIRQRFPNARFVAIKHAGHWVHADNPAGFLSVLEAFLRDWG
jgi:esterase